VNQKWAIFKCKRNLLCATAITPIRALESGKGPKGPGARFAVAQGVTTNLSPQLLSHLHERLAKTALPGIPRLTGKQVAKLTLELALRFPLAQALTQAIQTLGGPEEAAQAERICATAMKLIIEGLRVDDAVCIALHEPAAPTRVKAPLPEPLKRRLLPTELTGRNVLKYAGELNASGLAMDDAIIESIRKFSAPRTITQEQAEAVLDAAQKLFRESHTPAEALDIAIRRTLPKHD
jgi:hypothetical protein